MTTAADLAAILNAQPEPSFIVKLDGTIEFSSTRASAINSRLVAGNSILASMQEPEKFSQFLHRCAGNRDRCIGSLSLIDLDGRSVRFRVHANRLNRPEEGPARLFLRCLSAVDQRFAFLSKEVDQLNREVRKRRHLQAVLEESLRQRELLVREMHHRIKNNVATLAGMLALAQAETPSPEARSILKDTERRIAAIGAIQDVLYRSDTLGDAPARALVETLVRHLGAITPPGVSISTDIGDFAVRSDQALPLALIVNELVTNAIKHGLHQNPHGEIKVQFHCDDGRCHLLVRNPGKPFGIENAGRKASGLGLVRGLVRQLHGSFTMAFDRDVCCVVEFEGRRGNSDGHGSEGRPQSRH